MVNIDEIYELFIWGSSYTTEELTRREQQGLELAKSVKFLFPFIQPFLPDNSKSAWEPCAKVIADRSDEELVPYLDLLFEWLQDLSWPSAEIILDRLSKMPMELTRDALKFSRRGRRKLKTKCGFNG